MTNDLQDELLIRQLIEHWANGISILHFLGGSAIDVNGDRAIAPAKMTIGIWPISKSESATQ